MKSVCYRCEEDYAGHRARCECGEPLWYVPDAANYEPRSAPGMWRHADLLPLEEPAGIGAAAGGTPLVRSERLDDVAGCRVFVKDEAENPTGSYKDRGSAIAVAHAVERGHDAIGTVSYGNMAMSTAANAASVDLDCLVLVPTDTSPVRLALIAQYDPTVFQVAGDYGALYDEVVGFNDSPVAFYLSDPPTRIAGYATCIHEIVDQSDSIPDGIVLPTSSGGFASGVYRGLLDCQRAGLLSDLPSMYLVQTAESDPITRAFQADESVTPLSPDEVGDTIARSIGNPAPPSGNRALAGVRETDGSVVSVSDEELLAAKRQFAERAGLCVEPASSTTLAGVQRLTERGELAADDTVVLVPTGTGFKEMDTDVAPGDAETVERAALRDRLAAVLAAH
jgi:threonine synthase